jgi:hypothetical protein
MVRLSAFRLPPLCRRENLNLPLTQNNLRAAMTLGPRKEHVMTAKTEQQDGAYDVEHFRNELALEIERFIAEHLEAWTSCDNGLCRRAKRCASPDCECIAKWRESLPPLSPEQARVHLEPPPN